ncbi:MAG: hypothetical protein IJ774_13940 [Selenomonadaceae bacterium]|nr:hypothetical protein [Selenomonadaceae bacterium]MBR1807473.1 hypothetical protein [Selenomonadaceae bacterium]
MTGFKFPTLLRVVVLTLLFFAAAQVPTFAELKNFTVVNQTGRTIEAIYAVAADENAKPYEKNLLKAPLKHNKSVESEYNADYRYYNLTAFFEDGEVAFWDAVDCKKAQRLTIYKDGKGYNVDTD